GGGCEAFVQTGRAVIPVTAISIRRIPNDTAQTTVYRGHATAWPRTHHTTKLHPLCCRVREVLQHEPGKARPGGYPAVRTAHAARTEAVAESVNTFISSVQFLYTVTLEMPWGKECFPRLRVANRLPVVLWPEEVEEFFCHIPSLK